MKTPARHFINYFGLIFLMLLAVFCSGCGTLFNHPEGEDNRRPYGGVVINSQMGSGRQLGCGPLWYLDMPFSLVGDTLCLPYDAYYTHKVKAYQDYLKHAPPNPVPDPLADWKRVDWNGVDKPPLDKAIVVDYQDYIQKLPPEERDDVSPRDTHIVKIFEDKTGNHAVKLTLPVKGTWWEHDLIYDQNNKRIKTIKYAAFKLGAN